MIEAYLSRRFFGLRWPVIRALWRLRLRRKLLNYALAELELKLARRRLWSKPYWLVIDPNSGCDLHCPLCPTGKNKGTRERALMSWEHYMRLMDELGPTALHVEFSNWGEPLLNPRIFDMIRYAKSYGVEVHLSSHFNRFDERAAERLLDSGLDWIILSIDGATASTYSQYRVGGDFERVVANVRTLVKAKRRRGSRTPYAIWQCLVFRHNEHELEAVKALARETGVDAVGLSPAAIADPEMVPVGPGAYLYPERHSGKAQEMTNPSDFRANDGRGVPACVWPWLGTVVNSTGRVSPCCGIEDEVLDYGDAFELPFSRTWDGPDYQAGRSFVRDRRPGNRHNACTECRVIGKTNFSIPDWWSRGAMGAVPLEDVFRPRRWQGPRPFHLRLLLDAAYMRLKLGEIESPADLTRRAAGVLRHVGWKIHGVAWAAWCSGEKGYYQTRGRAWDVMRRLGLMRPGSPEDR